MNDVTLTQAIRAGEISGGLRVIDVVRIYAQDNQSSRGKIRVKKLNEYLDGVGRTVMSKEEKIGE